jgi:amino acid adenylation domain-containing protein/non-ribosomal peptide synthase protein (TIGR01720 family)/FkbM family methyltransferase
MRRSSAELEALSAEQRAAIERRLLARRPGRQAVDVIPARPSDRPIPLTFAQQRFWFLQQMDPDAPVYRMPVALRLKGAVSEPAVAAALTEIVTRHEVLRSTVQLTEEGPLQVVQPGGTFSLERADVSGTDAAAREQRMLDLAHEFSARPFDLERWPPFRALLVKLAPHEYVLVLTLHHIAGDLWSLAVLAREFGALYDEAVTATAASLPPPQLQYGDYACWQRDHMQGEVLERELTFWRTQLSGALPQLDLTTDFPRPAVQSFRGDQVRLQFPAQLITGLKALARRLDGTLFTTLTAALNVLLYRYTGQQDIMVGFAIAGRHRSEVESLIGPFVNTLVLRTDLSGDPNTEQLIGRVRERSLDAFSHQDAPFEMLVQELQPERDLSRNPLFQVLVGVQNVPMDRLSLHNVTLELVPLERYDSHVDLTLFVTEVDDAAEGVLEYNADLFERATVERMARHYLVLLDAMVEHPQRPISALPILTNAERRALTAVSTPLAIAETPPRSIVARFESAVARTPHAIAAVCDDVRLSYAELNARANQLACELVRAGVGPESKVALYLERSVDTVVAILATVKAGGAYVPLELSYPAERLAFMLSDSAPAVVLTQASLRAQLPSSAGTVLCLDSDWPQIAAHAGDNLAIPVQPSQLAYVIYTSGSTGRPKGVLVTHDNVCRLLDATEGWFHFDASDVWTLFHSFAFDFSVWELWGPLLSGGRVVVVPYMISRSPDAFLELLAREGVTVLNQTPSAFRQLAQADAAAGTPPLQLRTVIFGGEALDFQSLASWFERRGDARPRLVNMYGITETTVHVTYRPVTLGDVTGPSGSLIGVPIPDLQVRLLDGRGEPVPIGVPGEICVGGKGVARGYLNRPELTAQRFVPDPYASEPGARLYRSGDLARHLANGDVQYLGRMDDQIKIRGFRIELGEIQQVLAEHPAVQDAVVVPREFGPGDTRLVAYVTPHLQHAAPVREVMRLEAEGLLPPSKRHELPNGMAVAHLNRNETEFLYREVFEDQSYLRHGVHIDDGACVFDVGANIGMFTLFASQQARDVRVYAFEPIPPVFDLLRTNARLHGVHAQLFAAGAAEVDGQATFHYYPNVSIFSGRFADVAHERETVTRFVQNQQGAASSLSGTAAALLDDLISDRLETQAVACPLITLSSVIRRHQVEQIDLLKIDVEKSELQVLRGLAEEDWPKVRQTIIEVHDEHGRLAEIVALLQQHGFTTIVEQEAQLAGTDLYTIYAIRPGTERRPAAPSPALRWSSPSRMISDVKTAARQRLPEYMVPQSFVLLEALPLTSNGKLDRRALPAPEAQRVGTESSHTEAQSDVERTLVDIWTRVLRNPRVGIHDNFFELGGDSILSIQVVAAANTSGLRLTPRQMFQHPTIAELAAVAGTAAMPVATEDRPEGDVPLTPIQRWFFDQDFATPDHFNQSVLLRARHRVDMHALHIAAQRLVEHHDALRLRFEVGAEPRQRYAAADRHSLVDRVEIAQGGADLRAFIEQVSNDRQQSLSLAQGPLMRVTLFDSGGEGDSYVLIVIHHLVVDGVSWRILLDDLFAAYQQGRAGAPVQLPGKTASYQRWSQRLTEYAVSDALRQQTRFWTEGLPREASPLPLDTPDGRNTVELSDRVTATLTAEESHALIHDAPKALGTRIDDLLLTALSQVLSEWADATPVLVDLERHGREQLFGDDVDLSRTVGWFTAFVPLALEVTPRIPLSDAIKHTKEQLRRLPDRGIGFGVLKFLSTDPELRRVVASLPQPQVSFNYLGQFGPADEDWALATDLSAGADRARAAHRAHVLEIDSMVVDGRLHVVWTYGTELHRRVTIEQLAARFSDRVRALISHCAGADAPAFTPSDFPAARVSQDQLDKLMSKVGSRRPRS